MYHHPSKLAKIKRIDQKEGIMIDIAADRAGISIKKLKILNVFSNTLTFLCVVLIVEGIAKFDMMSMSVETELMMTTRNAPTGEVSIKILLCALCQ